MAMSSGKMILYVNHIITIALAEENLVTSWEPNVWLPQIFLFESVCYFTASRENRIKHFEKNEIHGKCHFNNQSL